MPLAAGINAAAANSAAETMHAKTASNGLVTIDFEGYTSFTAVTTQYSTFGVTFAGATVLIQGQSLNSPYPPHSGVDVAYDDPANAGTITTTFSRAVASAGAYVTSWFPVNLTCYDRNGGAVGSSTLPGANYLGAGTGVAPNYLLSVVGQGITSCVFQGNSAGNDYTIDDFTFGPTGAATVPTSPPTGPRSYGAPMIDVCFHDPAPSGYIAVTLDWTLNCSTTTRSGHTVFYDTPSFGPNMSRYAYYADKPIGTRMDVCTSEAIPPGWVEIPPFIEGQCAYHNVYGIKLGGSKGILRVN